MTKIEPATREDVQTVAQAMREQDFREFRATSRVSDRHELASLLAQRYGGRHDVLAGFWGGDPVCIGGTIEMWPGVISLLFFATDDFPRIGRGITRWIKRDLFPRYLDSGIHRIQAISHGEHAVAHAWLRSLGLHEEARFDGFGRNNEPFVQFALVKGGEASEQHQRRYRSHATQPLPVAGGA